MKNYLNLGFGKVHMAYEVIFLLKCLYFMLPAYLANMAPVIVKKINFLNYPVDFGIKLRGKPLLGSHKTYRGFFFGILFAIALSFVQYLLYPIQFFQWISLQNYSNWLQFGFLMGFGALFGDSLKSLIKRRVKIKPGARFIPFDQIDFVIGAVIFTIPVFDLTWKVFLTCILFSFALHIIVNHLAFWLGIRNVKW
jgi:CDP-2,3-bis-(O-geranylgeranyl)-sn-glycerol synthase